ncbi:hypothetical protein N9L06_02325 [Mariniblastus sp.]|nr:hypothetical protein [Mariniblastus sp.]
MRSKDVFQLLCVSAFVGCLLVITGCKKEAVVVEGRAHARGVVLLDGEPLVGGGTVKFQSVKNPRIRVSVKLDQDGQFRVAQAPAGEVRMSVVTTPDIYPEMTPIPKKYSSLKTSKLSGTIEHGVEAFEIELKSKP